MKYTKKIYNAWIRQSINFVRKYWIIIFHIYRINTVVSHRLWIVKNCKKLLHWIVRKSQTNKCSFLIFKNNMENTMQEVHLRKFWTARLDFGRKDFSLVLDISRESLEQFYEEKWVWCENCAFCYSIRHDLFRVNYMHKWWNTQRSRLSNKGNLYSRPNHKNIAQEAPSLPILKFTKNL